MARLEWRRPALAEARGTDRRSATGHGIQIAIFRSFEEAKQVWADIEARGACFLFQSYEWCSVWFETVGRRLGIEPCLVHARDRTTQAEIFLPLGVHRRRGLVRCLEFLGGRLADHTAPIVVGPADRMQDDAWMTALLGRIRHVVPFDVADFRHLCADVDGQHNPLVTPVARRARYRTHSLAIQGSWSAYSERRLTAKHRADGRRCWRRLSDRGTPRFEIADTIDAALAITKVMFAQKSPHFREVGAFDLFSKSEYREYFLRATRDYHQSGMIHVSALMLDDRVLATHWGAIWRNRLLSLLPSYERGEWSRFAPGRLLLEFLLEWSFKRGLAAFDFTIGDEGYKQTYCSTSDDLHRQVWPRTPLGWAYYAHWRLSGR